METTQGTPETTPSALGTPTTPQVNPPVETGASAAPIAPEAIARMEEEIARLTRQGYVIINRTQTSAQLRRPKHFSIWWALFWFLIGGFGLPLYIAWYLLVKRDRLAFVRITPEGRVLCSEG
jgi:hypothetical protein